MDSTLPHLTDSGERLFGLLVDARMLSERAPKFRYWITDCGFRQIENPC